MISSANGLEQKLAVSDLTSIMPWDAIQLPLRTSTPTRHCGAVESTAKRLKFLVADATSINSNST